MNELNSLKPAPIASTVQKFVSDASDLYVDFLTEGRKRLAGSLLSGLVLAIATLEQVTKLPAGPERSRGLRRAAGVFHKLSLLIFVSAVNKDDGDETDLRTLHAYDAAADLSGLLANAARAR
ncbi:MAG TPA: hypothetical protein VMW69_02890 [Spirochaetia bacterium]|nr:hypothetical protein [Spirochaetia bacterium]